MNKILEEIKKKQIINKINFKVGDIICVNSKIIDSENKNQNFEGIVLSIKKNTFTLRKISLGEGIEKTFFSNSPTINWIQIKKEGRIKKAKIFNIRKKNKIS